MSSVLVRPLVEAFGERGSISLPIVEQLLPTVSAVDLELLGAPAWVPWVGTFTLGAVAAQRSALEIRGDPSRILVIEEINTVGVDAQLGLSAGIGIAAGGATGFYATDMRRWPNGGVGVLLYALVGTQAIAGISAVYTEAWNFRTGNDWKLVHPIYLTGPRQNLMLYGAADNTALFLYMRGRVLVRQ